MLRSPEEMAAGAVPVRLRSLWSFPAASTPHELEQTTVCRHTHISALASEVPWPLSAPGCRERQSALACSERNHKERRAIFRAPFRASEGEVQIAVARRAHRRQPLQLFQTPVLPSLTSPAQEANKGKWDRKFCLLAVPVGTCPQATLGFPRASLRRFH